MAIINCPECEGKVSDTVFKCPHCGFNLSGYNAQKKHDADIRRILEADPGLVCIRFPGVHYDEYSISYKDTPGGSFTLRTKHEQKTLLKGSRVVWEPAKIERKIDINTHFFRISKPMTVLLQGPEMLIPTPSVTLNAVPGHMYEMRLTNTETGENQPQIGFTFELAPNKISRRPRPGNEKLQGEVRICF